MSHDLRVLCTPEVASGFALAGVSAVERAEPGEAATRIASLVRTPGLGLLLVEDTLYDTLDAEQRHALTARPLPMVVPFPGPSRVPAALQAERYVVELLRQAIGYGVRLR